MEGIKVLSAVINIIGWFLELKVVIFSLYKVFEPMLGVLFRVNNNLNFPFGLPFYNNRVPLRAILA